MLRFFKIGGFLPALIFLGLTACFGGVQKTGKVVSYQPGKVITKKGYYQVGQLSPDWGRINLNQAVIAFYNAKWGATISTDAFCDQAYDDSSLPMLTKHLMPGLQDVKVVEEKPLKLDDRGALRTLFKASLDGVPVMVDAVIIKKDWCLFDFYLVTPPPQHAEAAMDFEGFYQGFAFQGAI